MSTTTIFTDRKAANRACDAANEARTREEFLAGRWFVFERHGFLLMWAARGSNEFEPFAPCTLNPEIAAFVTRKEA